MPVVTYFDPERPRGDQAVKGYGNVGAQLLEVTDAGLEAARQVRREAGADIAHWAGLKAVCGRFAKDEQKRAQRTEKAATLWLRHFDEPGHKSIRNMPLEMAAELDSVFGRMALA
jgi:hypothetical protein